MQLLRHFCFATDHVKKRTTAFCPVLGRRYPEIYRADCPVGLKSPMGKKLQVSFAGSKPYVQLNPSGGSDFDIINLLAKKFKFLPQFTPEFPSHEMVKKV